MSKTSPLGYSQEYNLSELVTEAAIAQPAYEWMGDIFAEGGTTKVERGVPAGIRQLTIPARIQGRTISKSYSAAKSRADLFSVANLAVGDCSGNLVTSLAQIKFCLGRGTLVKLLECVDLDDTSSHFKKAFKLRITRLVHGNNTYFVVEDTEEWIVSSEYGHGAANFVTTVDKGYADWYHYVYHLLHLNAEDGTAPCSILLRNEVDAVYREEDNLHVEIKSHNSNHPIDMKHCAFCVLTGQTAGLYVIARKPMGKIASIVSGQMFDRDDLKSDGRKELYLKSLGAIKFLLTKVYATLSENEADQAYLDHEPPVRYGSAVITLTL